MKKNKGDQFTVLAVDDNAITCEVIHRNLQLKGYHTITVQSVKDAVRVLESRSIDLVITDYKMPRQSGLELIRFVREHDSNIPVIMLTGYGSVKSAVSAMKEGADEYITKPFTDDELVDTVEKIINRNKLLTIDPASIYSDTWNKFGIIGESVGMREVYSKIEKASQNDATVLITGENGTGKELVARAVHYHHSKRSVNPFVPVNCPGIPVNLFESELFGHTKGAFTGADQNRKGFFQAAEKGSLFLDEISELPLEVQAKFLRVLQEKEIFKVGESRLRKVDVRIVAATNKNLEALIKKGMFRQDLYFRLNVIDILIPPLRTREADIMILAKHFAVKYAKELGRKTPSFTDRAVAALEKYTWPGNVRELENLIYRSLIMSDSDVIDHKSFPKGLKQHRTQQAALNLSLDEMTRKYVRDVVVQTGGNKARALEILKIDRKTLLKKMK